MALAVAVVHRMKAMGEEGADGELPKKLEHPALVSVSWAVEVAVGWPMDGVDQAKEVVQLDLWEEAEGVRQR